MKSLEELERRATAMRMRHVRERRPLEEQFCELLRPFAEARLKDTEPFSFEMEQHWVTGFLMQAGMVLVDLEDPADGREWSKFAKDMSLRELLQVAEAAEGIVQQIKLSDL